MKRCLFLLVLTSILTSGLLAFNPGDKKLTLKECINLALERNISAIQARNDVESKQSNVQANFGSFLPNLNLSGSWNRGERTSKSEGYIMMNGIQIPTGTSSSLTSTTNSFNTYLSSEVILFNGFANTGNYSASKSTALASEFNLKRTEQGLIMQTYELYFNVLRTRQLLKLREDNVKYSAQQLDRIKESEKLGAASLASVYQQQAQLASDELALTQAESDYDKAIADLTAYLALNITEEVQFEDPSVKNDIDPNEYKSLRNSLENFKSLVEKGFISRPDYRSSTENFNAAQCELSASKGSYYPSVRASVNYSLNSIELSKINDNRNLSWGLSISVPIFAKFQTDNSVQQAEIQKKNSEITLNEKARSIQVDIKKAILDLDAAYKSYESAKKSATYQKENMKIIQEKYNLGSSTLLDLLYATNNYNNAETTRVNSIYQYLAAIKAIDYAMGTLSN
jgi:outer membrane protein